jgi:hypothetical protein
MSDSFEFGGDIVWEPTPEYVGHANLTHLMYQVGIIDFGEMMRHSTENVAWFTENIRLQKPSYSFRIYPKHAIPRLCDI